MADDDNLPLPATEIVKKLISSFINSTSPSRERAISFLHTHQWDLSAAVSAFTGNNVADAAAAQSNIYNNPSNQQLHGTLAARTRNSNLRIDIPVSSHSPSGYIPSESISSWLQAYRARKPFSSEIAATDKPCESQTIERRQSTGNIRPLADISGGTDSDSDESEEHNDGGEQRVFSGRIVQDPKKDEDDDDKAKESDVQQTPVVQSSRPATFRNVPAGPQQYWTHFVTIWKNGYTVNNGPLKALDNPFLERIQRLQSPRELNPQDMQIRLRFKVVRRQEEYLLQEFKIIPEAGPREVLTNIVTIWRNGYTIDNGPLKTLDNPENAKFLEQVQSLQSPRYLNPQDMQIRHRVKLIRRQEEYFNVHHAFRRRRRLIIPFQGVGRTLSGQESASTDPPASSLSYSTQPPASSESLTTTQPPLFSRVVDPAAPTTLIQLRLADSFMVFRFNTHQTVRDVRDFIDAGLIGSKDYQLLIMGSPPKPVLDFDQTIEKAGISNSVLIMKF